MRSTARPRNNKFVTPFSKSAPGEKGDMSLQIFQTAFKVGGDKRAHASIFLILYPSLFLLLVFHFSFVTM